MQKKEPYLDVTVPDVILLDRYLPKIDGFEVLNYIKNNSVLQHVKVVMMAGSKMQEELLKNELEQKVNAKPDGYVVKPLVMQELSNTLS